MNEEEFIHKSIKEKENSTTRQVEDAKIEKMMWRRHMILGDEYHPQNPKTKEYGKVMEAWEGQFFILAGRKMTEAEFMDFCDKFEKASAGWGIADYVKEVVYRMQ